MKPRGFTLLEVLVALAIAGVVATLAHRIFMGVTEGAARLTVARTALDRQSNARRWLIEAFGSLDVGSGGAGGFAGRRDRVEFASWLLGARGWFERQRVGLSIERDQLVARFKGAETIVLADSVTGLAFDYLLEPGANEMWVREWLSPLSAPLAVRLRIVRPGTVDTLLLVVGARG